MPARCAGIAVWTLAAIAPHDRGDWLLENLLVFGLAGLVTAAHQRFPFSNLSYLPLWYPMYEIGRRPLGP